GLRSAGSMGISTRPVWGASARYRRPMSTTPATDRPEAVIFDLDGTLVDTVERRIEAWMQAFEHAGIPGTREAVSPLIGAAGQVRASVEAHGLEHEPTIVDGSHVKHAKPEPDLLLMAADQLKADPPHTWYVGDSTFDMEAAVAAGMHPIGVTTGSAGIEALRRA